MAFRVEGALCHWPTKQIRQVIKCLRFAPLLAWTEVRFDGLWGNNGSREICKRGRIQKGTSSMKAVTDIVIKKNNERSRRNKVESRREIKTERSWERISILRNSRIKKEEKARLTRLK